MKITLSKLTTKNLATLAQRIINSSQDGNYTVVANHPLLISLQSVYAEYDSVYTKSIYSGKGMDVAEADRERDEAFSTLKAFLNGYRKLPSAANRQAAQDLYAIFKQYGLDIDRMSYSSETAQMKKLLETLETTENAQKITALSLTAAFTELKTKQESFEMLFAEQAEANADLRLMASATIVRKNLEKAIKAYLGLLTAMKAVEGWQAIYADIAEIVKAAKNSVIVEGHSSSSNSNTEKADSQLAD
jgi:hemoglobin-like flavoprotein